MIKMWPVVLILMGLWPGGAESPKPPAIRLDAQVEQTGRLVPVPVGLRLQGAYEEEAVLSRSA